MLITLPFWLHCELGVGQSVSTGTGAPVLAAEAAGCTAGLTEESLADLLPVAAEPVRAGRFVYGQSDSEGRRGGCGQAVLARPGNGCACLSLLEEVGTVSESLQGHSTQI